MLSKCVQPNELGKIYSLLASLEAAGKLVLKILSELKPVLNHTGKSHLASYYRQPT